MSLPFVGHMGLVYVCQYKESCRKSFASPAINFNCQYTKWAVCAMRSLRMHVKRFKRFVSRTTYSTIVSRKYMWHEISSRNERIEREKIIHVAVGLPRYDHLISVKSKQAKIWKYLSMRNRFEKVKCSGVEGDKEFCVKSAPVASQISSRFYSLPTNTHRPHGSFRRNIFRT